MPRARTPRVAIAALLAAAAGVAGGCKSAPTGGTNASAVAVARPADAKSDLAYFDALDAASTVSFDDGVRGVLAVTGMDTSGDAAARLARGKAAGLVSDAAIPDTSAISVGQAAGLVVRGSGGDAATPDDAVARLRESGLIAADAMATDPARGPQFLAMLSGLRARLASGQGSFGPARAPAVATIAPDRATPAPEAVAPAPAVIAAARQSATLARSIIRAREQRG